jgi:hypothetical protein
VEVGERLDHTFAVPAPAPPIREDRLIEVADATILKPTS